MLKKCKLEEGLEESDEQPLHVCLEEESIKCTCCPSFRLRLHGDVINENEQGHDRHDTHRRVNGLKNENENANECMRSFMERQMRQN